MKIEERFFDEAQDALFLIDKKKGVKKNKAAKMLEKRIIFSLDKVLEVATGQGCMLHSTMEKCLHCGVKEEWNQAAFPIILEKNNRQQEQFSGSYTIYDDGVSLLSLRRLAVQDRLQQMIQDKRLIEYVNQAHENERRALSQELHDGLAQSIYSLMLETRQLNRTQKPDEVASKLQKIDENFVALLTEVKQMAIDLRPTALDDLGLVAAIETLLQRLTETTGVEIHFIPILTQRRFFDKLETITYRVLQESVMNSIKHADVDELWVTLKEQDSQLILTVIDHGKGFDVQIGQENSNGLGLYHMQERAESIDGKLVIQSEKSVGTTVSLRVPINREVKK